MIRICRAQLVKVQIISAQHVRVQHVRVQIVRALLARVQLVKVNANAGQNAFTCFTEQSFKFFLMVEYILQC